MNGWMDGLMDGLMDGWMDGWMDGNTLLNHLESVFGGTQGSFRIHLLSLF